MFTAHENYVMDSPDVRSGTHCSCHGPDRDDDAKEIADALNFWRRMKPAETTDAIWREVPIGGEG